MTRKDKVEEKIGGDMSEFLEKGATVIDAKAEDVKPSPQAEEDDTDEEEAYVVPEHLKPLGESITAECQLLIQRARLLEHLQKEGVIPNALAFTVIDETIISAFTKNIAELMGISVSDVEKLFPVTLAKKAEADEMTANFSEDGKGKMDYGEFAQYHR